MNIGADSSYQVMNYWSTTPKLFHSRQNIRKLPFEADLTKQ